MNKHAIAIARAVGVIGATAAVMVGISFANLSTQVSLTNNALASGTAALQISNDNVTYGASAGGLNFSHLIPGVTSSPFTFYINNNGDIPLTVTVQAPDATDGTNLKMSDITMNINCGSGSITKTLSDFQASAWTVPGSPLSNGSTWTCQATALLASSYTGSGDTMPTFTLTFVGNQ